MVPVVFSVANYRGKTTFLRPSELHDGVSAILKCQFDSYPAPTMQWVKMIRTVQDPDGGQVLVQDNDPQVIDILTRQIGPTLYETQLTVRNSLLLSLPHVSVLQYNPMEQDFGLNFECRAINPRVGRYLINLRRAELPRQVRVLKVEPRSNAIQLNIQPPLEMGGLPLLEYIVKFEQIGVPNSFQSQTFPATTDEGQSIRVESLQPSTLYRMHIFAKSRAGEGALSVPYQLKTLDRQVPQFKILSADPSCLDDRTCLIRWVLEADGGSTVSRAEISYAQVR